MTANIYAQGMERNVWPDVLPADVEYLSGQKEEVVADDGLKRIMRMPVPTLEKFEVKYATRDKVIIVCPGGAYVKMAITHEGTDIAQWLNTLGYTCYILRYRVPDCRDGALQDLQRAIRMVRTENPGKKVGVIGFSAGASLACRAATRHRVESYTRTDAVDEASQQVDFCSLIYPAYMDLGEGHTLTPELTVDSTTPPMFVFQTADDEYGNSSLVISQALRQHRVPVELHVYPRGGHGYGLRQSKAPVAAVWPRLMADWLETL